MTHPAPDAEAAHAIRISYLNWRGEHTQPLISPTRVFFGSNEYHPEPCWLLEARDIEKDAWRTYDLSKIGHRPAEATPSTVAPAAVDADRVELPGGAYYLRCQHFPLAHPWVELFGPNDELLLSGEMVDPHAFAATLRSGTAGVPDTFPRLVKNDPQWVEIARGHFVSADGDRGKAALAEIAATPDPRSDLAGRKP